MLIVEAIIIYLPNKLYAAATVLRPSLLLISLILLLLLLLLAYHIILETNDCGHTQGWRHEFESEGGPCIGRWGGVVINTIKTLTFEKGGECMPPPSTHLLWWHRPWA